jgi:hypothetical protein
VLRREGLVYAETPFMQQVHERAYDFSRFTQSGHRWLFKRFSEISAGPIGGAGVALVWSIRYFSRALGAGSKLSLLISLPFFWIRYLDAFARGRAVADAASGFFFLGRRADQAIDPHSMTKYYDRQKWFSCDRIKLQATISLRRRRFEGNAARLSGLAVRLHDYLNVLLEHGEHFHQAFGRIVVKVAAQ